MKRLQSQKLLAVASVGFVVACGTEPPKSAKGDASQTGSELSKSQAQSNAQAASLAKPQSLALLSPADARLLLIKQPEMTSANEESTLKVPTATIAFRQADYAWILRCKSSYIPRNALGEDLFAKTLSAAEAHVQMKWMWQEALGSTQNCAQVSSKNLSTQIVDFTAPDGEYFYLLNPCLNKDKSSDKNETCSYDIVKTVPFQSQNKLSSEFINAAQKVAQAEATHAALLLRLRYLAEIVQLNKEACEHNDAVLQKQENLWKGLGSLLATGIGAMASGVFSGGATSLEGARAGLNFALSIFGKKAHTQIQCPIIAETLKAAQEVTAALPDAQKKVLLSRNELAKMNSEFAHIDETIMSQNEDTP